MVLDHPVHDAVVGAADIQRVGQDDRLFQIAGFIDPVRAGHLAVAVEGMKAPATLSFQGSALGKTAVAPVRMSCPWIMVRLATRTPGTSVIPSSGPVGKNPKWKGSTACRPGRPAAARARGRQATPWEDVFSCRPAHTFSKSRF